jgi:hypothetical protein
LTHQRGAIGVDSPGRIGGWFEGRGLSTSRVSPPGPPGPTAPTATSLCFKTNALLKAMDVTLLVGGPYQLRWSKAQGFLIKHL